MPSITSWTRLEPRSRGIGVQQGLQARIHDPLWMLARQWQMGEFQAEDAGMPVTARLRGEAARPARYHTGAPGDGPTSRPYDGHTPLEAVVEREPLTTGAAAPHPARAAEAGLHFLRLLDAFGVGRYRSGYQSTYVLVMPDDSTLDEDGARFVRVMAGRAVDGARLYADLAPALRRQDGTEGLPETPAVESSDRNAVIEAARKWLAWYDGRFSEPAGDAAWVPERMEYAFAVSVPTRRGEIVLAADEYHGGRLDWYHFNRRSGGVPGAALDEHERAPLVRTVIPGPVSFLGMPDTRWWAFEDAEIDLGSMEVGAEDLGRMLLLQFALNYSDDWFTMPVELAVGTLLQIDSLVVTDTFGVRTLIRPYDQVDGRAGAWRMFAHTEVDAGSGAASTTGDGSPNDFHLFLPPVLGSSLHGKPVEEVRFLRDETANMAWAVERLVENARGTAYDRHEHYVATRPDPTELERTAPEDADLIYTLATEVPEHWIPLVPTLDAETTSMRLRRGRMLQHRGNALVDVRPQGRVLEPGADLRLFEEEVPRAGAHVTRSFQLTRWFDGSTHLWMARRRTPGRGEGWSGLRYDFVETVPPPA